MAPNAAKPGVVELKLRRPVRSGFGLALLVTLTLSLGGCATGGMGGGDESGNAGAAADAGFAGVAAAARQRLGDGVELRWVRDEAERESAQRRVETLLQQPLTADAAVQIALLNNAGLQAAFFELGIAQADWLQAGTLPNPGFSFGRLRQGHEVEFERGLHLNLARLLTLGAAQAVESRRVAQARGAAALQVLNLASETRKAWVQAVAAEESLRYALQVMEAAQASAELAQRMRQAGNFNRLQQLREQSFYADAALGAERAQQQRTASRERLIRHLGLWGAQTAFTLPERLPDLPKSLAQRPEIEREALAQRLDVQGARHMVEQTARQLGLSRQTRFVNVLDLGWQRNSSSEAPVQKGWEVSFELPLFDWGTARVARADSVYGQALARAADTAIQARSEVREAYAAYRSAWDIARHQREEIVVLRQQISQENLLRYNGMLLGVFELLADARGQIASVRAAIDASRDFWLAQADLDMALVGRPSLAAAGLATNVAGQGEPAGGAGH